MRHVQPLVLDCKLRDYGPVVPQSISTPTRPKDALRYNDVSLKMPIFFVHANRKTPGLRLKGASAGNFEEALSAQALALVEDLDFDTTRICVRVSVSQVANHEAVVRIIVHF